MKVAVIMGSESDYEVMHQATEILNEFNIEVDEKIVSAHRTPEYMYEFASNAVDNYDLIIAGAGGAAHLPGMVAALTVVPVIGIPIKSKTLKGVDSLLSIVQMPFGVPVATVAINGSKNAASFSVAVLGVNDLSIRNKYNEFREKQTKQVLND